MPPVATTFEIVDPKAWMCGRLARMLRSEHQAAADRLGLDIHRNLSDVYHQSYYRKAILIDGKLAALGGAVGSALSPAVFVWFALSERATRYPVRIVKIARAQMAEVMRDRLECHTTIIDGDEAAKRLAVFLGWHVADAGPGAAAATRYGRKTLTDFIDHEPSLRIPFGRGHAIRMAFHPAEGAS